MVQLTLDAATRALELVVMFHKKNGFQLVEFEAIGGLFTRLSKVVNGAEDKSVDLSLDDVKLVISTIDVCSRRVPVEVANFRTVADLLSVLEKVTKDAEEQEETKTEL